MPTPKVKTILLLTLSMAPLAFGADPAQLKLHCLSPMVDRAVTRLFGLDYVMEVTTADSSQPANGEMAVASPDTGYTHTGAFAYTDPTLFETFYLPFLLDLPISTDKNGNGFADFFLKCKWRPAG